MHLRICLFLLPPTHVWLRKELLLGQTLEMILLDLQVLRPNEKENHIFSDWSLFLCVSVCHQYNKNKLQQKFQS